MASSPRSLKIQKGLRNGFYWMFAGLFASGCVWWILDRLVRVVGSFGEVHHPLQVWLMKVHGLLAQGLLLVLGAIYVLHIKPGLKNERNKGSGWWMVGLFLGMAATGYLLYYIAGEIPREYTSVVHLGLGIASPAMVALHVYLGRRALGHTQQSRSYGIQISRSPSLSAPK